MTDETNQLADLIRESRSIFLFTGAGVSTGSGIPDFRGPNGVWKQRQPVYYDDFMSSEAARIEHWDYKLEGWAAFRDATPNVAHKACVELKQSGKLHLLVTQNIDGLHTKAGTSRKRIVEIHGTNSEIECQSCGQRSDPDPVFKQFAETRKPPTCECGGWLKPATISFGQNLRSEDLARAETGARNADLAIALGSTLSVTPAATFPLLAAMSGARYAIVNRGDTDHDNLPEVTLRIEADVTEIFPEAVKQALND